MVSERMLTKSTGKSPGLTLRKNGGVVMVTFIPAFVSQKVKNWWEPLEALTLAEWDASMSIDLRASFLCAHAAIPHMKKSGGGRIVNFTDWVAASRRPRYTGFLPYYVAKMGVIALTEALGIEGAGEVVALGAGVTGLLHQLPL